MLHSIEQELNKKPLKIITALYPCHCALKVISSSQGLVDFSAEGTYPAGKWSLYGKFVGEQEFC